LRTETGISKGFIIAIIAIVIGITAYFYINENKFIENSTPIPGKITKIKRIPRQQVLTVQAKDEVKRKITISSWDDRKAGDDIKIRVGGGGYSQVKTDEFMYLHKASIGFFTGCLILFCIVSGVYLFKKK